MTTLTEQRKAVGAYRRAARKLYGYDQAQAEACIYGPENDPGEWAPDALVILNFERGLSRLAYNAPDWLDESVRFQEEAGVGFVEHINGAVAAVWPI